jgi:hypothetical protein
MYAGDVETNVMSDDAMNNQMDDFFVEGINDTANDCPACHRCTNNVLAIETLIWTLELGEIIQLIGFISCHKPLHCWMP